VVGGDDGDGDGDDDHENDGDDDHENNGDDGGDDRDDVDDVTVGGSGRGGVEVVA